MQSFRLFFIKHQGQVRLGQKSASDKLRQDVVTRELADAYVKTSPQGAEIQARAHTVLHKFVSISVFVDTRGVYWYRTAAAASRDAK